MYYNNYNMTMNITMNHHAAYNEEQHKAVIDKFAGYTNHRKWYLKSAM